MRRSIGLLPLLAAAALAQGKSKWNPPADLPHLKATPAEARKRIDDLVAVLLDPKADRGAAWQARDKLVKIGKPAFPRILGAMAGVRDRITDKDTKAERALEAALQRADECLRGMDGYLDSKSKRTLRPGADRKYIAYILRLHYRRWKEVLEKAARMPGPYGGRWDPPADLGHLKETPAELRGRIDKAIDVLLDPMAGLDSLKAREQLAAIGKPAFPRILGAMAKVRDTITDVDNMDERLLESSLKLADECLRKIDPYLNEMGKQPIRPGTDKKYIAYILRLHYKRWQQVLAK